MLTKACAFKVSNIFGAVLAGPGEIPRRKEGARRVLAQRAFHFELRLLLNVSREADTPVQGERARFRFSPSG